jgi:hypothetical protein
MDMTNRNCAFLKQHEETHTLIQPESPPWALVANPDKFAYSHYQTSIIF